MSVKIWINKKHIYLSCYVCGRRWRESTGLTVSSVVKQNKAVMELAEIIRSKKELSLAAFRFGVINPESGKISVVSYFSEQLKTKPKKHSLRYVMPYLEKFAGNMRMEMLSPFWVEKFQDYLKSQSTLSLGSCEVYMQAIRAVLKIAVRDNVLVKDPGYGVKHVRYKEKVKEFLLPSEVELLDSWYPNSLLRKEIKDGFFIGILTGLRISDLKQLEWEEIDFSSNIIKKLQKKTGNVVYIPLIKKAREILQERKFYIEHSSKKVFPLMYKRKGATNLYLEEWGNSVGLQKHMGWHLARHTFATLLLEGGADIYTVQKLLGHKEIKTTARYAKVTDHKVREAIMSFPTINIVNIEKNNKNKNLLIKKT